ncbi:LapA family protein [Halobacillus sp. Cin3]|nr:LapA family protein [Halobacillus sp. Cin3]
MDWLWSWMALSLAVGAFYTAEQAKKENKRLKERLDRLERKSDEKPPS